MANEIQGLIEELMEKMERQRLQISALEAAQNQAGPSTPQQTSTKRKFDSFSVPDPIKLIPQFAGEPALLSSWIDSVDQKIDFCENVINDQTIVDRVMPLWVGIIRDKIIKEGNDVLARNQVTNDWELIKKALKAELGDQRDLATLSSKITQLKQGGQDLTEYYHQCKKLMADINANLLANDDTKSCVKILMVNYEAMITNAFIDGLQDHLSALTRIYKPKNLQEAYAGALEQHQSNLRRKEKVKAQEPTKLFSPQSKPMNRSFVPPAYRSDPNHHPRMTNFQPNYQPRMANFQPNNQQPRIPNFYPNHQQARTSNFQPNHQSFRPPMHNPNSIPAIKHEPHSHQIRSFNRPLHNVNTHESQDQFHYADQNLPYHEMTYDSAYAYEENPDVSCVETNPAQQSDTCEKEVEVEIADNLNFHIVETHLPPV